MPDFLAGIVARVLALMARLQHSCYRARCPRIRTYFTYLTIYMLSIWVPNLRVGMESINGTAAAWSTARVEGKLILEQN